MAARDIQAMKKNITTLFGLGYLPFSASLASLAALVVFVLVHIRFSDPGYIDAALFIIVLAVGLYELRRDKMFSSPDPHEIVVDEFLGMYLCLIIAAPTALVGAGLFIIFRLLDVLKPWPINTLDRACKNWWGIVADDIVIGIAVALLWRVSTLFL